jgi:hypothetical protein
MRYLPIQILVISELILEAASMAEKASKIRDNGILLLRYVFAYRN